MTSLDPALREHAERLLVGTDLTVDDLLDVATGITPSSAPAAAAVRDGWSTAASTSAALAEPVDQP